jgi:hypothetical protein
LAAETVRGRTTTTVRWALTDQEGTVRDVVSNSGGVLDHIIHGSLGNPSVSSNTPHSWIRMDFHY